MYLKHLSHKGEKRDNRDEDDDEGGNGEVTRRYNNEGGMRKRKK